MKVKPYTGKQIISSMPSNTPDTTQHFLIETAQQDKDHIPSYSTSLAYS